MNAFARREELSPGARARLHELARDFELRLISEARRLNPDDVLTSRDVADAFDHVASGGESDSVDRAAHNWLTGAATVRMFSVSSIIAGLLAVTAAALALADSWAGAGFDTGLFLVTALAYLSGAISIATTLVAARVVRRARTRAVRYAEQGGRSTELAYELAEAMEGIQGLKSGPDATISTMRFIRLWAQLEDRLRRLSLVALNMPEELIEDYPIGLLLEELSERSVLNEQHTIEFMQILDVRNRLAHGGRATPGEIKVGLDYMRSLEDYLDDYIQRHLRTGPRGGDLS